MFNNLKKVAAINLKKVNCPDCGEEQPKARKPKNMRQALWGGNTCESCGCEMDRFGNKVEKKA